MDPTKQRQFQTCLFVSVIKRFFERKLCQIYWHKPIFFQKLWARSTSLFGPRGQKDATSSMSPHLLPLSLTYLQVLEQWNFLVRNFHIIFLNSRAGFWFILTLHSQEYKHVIWIAHILWQKYVVFSAGGSYHDAFLVLGSLNIHQLLCKMTCCFRLWPKTCS